MVGGKCHMSEPGTHTDDGWLVGCLGVKDVRIEMKKKEEKRRERTIF